MIQRFDICKFTLLGLFVFMVTFRTVSAQQAENWRLYYDKQEFKTAESLLSELHNMYPDSIMIQEYLGLTYHHLGRLDKSMSIWGSILSKDSLHTNALYRTGLYHYEHNRYQDAIFYWLKLSASKSDNPFYFKLLGQAYRQLEDPLSAFQAYARAHSLNSADLETIYQLSSLFFKQKQFHETDSLIMVGLRLYPEHEKLQLLQIETCYSSGYYDHAIDLLEEMRSNDNMTNYLRRLLAVCYIQQKNSHSAIEVLKEIESPDNNEEMTYYYLHKAHYQLNDLILARHFLEKCLEACAHPNEGKYLAIMGNVLVDSERYSEAAMKYETASALTGDPQLMYLAGRAYDAAEKYDMAIFRYKLFIRQDNGQLDEESLTFAKERINILQSVSESTVK